MIPGMGDGDGTELSDGALTSVTKQKEAFGGRVRVKRERRREWGKMHARVRAKL